VGTPQKCDERAASAGGSYLQRIIHRCPPVSPIDWPSLHFNHEVSRFEH